MFTLELSENDVTFLDDVSNNIYIEQDVFGFDDVTLGDDVCIYFDEDTEDIAHRYTVEDVRDGKIYLQWKRIIQEDTLTEANPLKDLKARKKDHKKFNKGIDKAIKKTTKIENKILKQGEKLVKRDIGPDGMNWKFYLAKLDKNGHITHETKPITQKEFLEVHSSAGELSPQVANAIVTNESRGTQFIVRRGLEDCLGEGIAYKVGTKLLPAFTFPWESSSNMNPIPDPKEEPDPQPQEEPKEDPKPEPSPEPKPQPEPKEEPKQDQNITSTLTSKQIAAMVRSAFEHGGKTPDKKIMNRLTDMLKKKLGEEFDSSLLEDEQFLEELMLESPLIKLTDDDLNDPANINLDQKRRQAVEDENNRQAAIKKQEFEAEMREKNADLISKVKGLTSSVDALSVLFNELVPPEGPASTIAGEMVRAMMRLLYRDYNDGDKFFEGYGIETCSESASYLSDKGLAQDIQHMLDMSHILAEDDDKYTAALELMAQHVVEYIQNNEYTLWTANEEDSRDYDNSYIIENQPRYEYEIAGSDDIIQLVDNGVLTSWDLKEYVESQLEWNRAYEGAVTSRPWGHHDHSVTIENLTKDGYDLIQDSAEDLDGFWADLVSEHADELDNNDYDDDYDRDVD